MKDLMDNEDGTFACALWCDDGKVTERGTVCRKCQLETAMYRVLNCAYAWYEAEVEPGEEELRLITKRELMEAIEDREILLSEG